MQPLLLLTRFICSFIRPCIPVPPRPTQPHRECTVWLFFDVDVGIAHLPPIATTAPPRPIIMQIADEKNLPQLLQPAGRDLATNISDPPSPPSPSHRDKRRGDFIATDASVSL